MFRLGMCGNTPFWLFSKMGEMNQMKKIHLKGYGYISAILFVTVAFYIVCPSNNYYKSGDLTMTNKSPLQFNKDGTFKIMLIADIQENATVSPYTLELMEKALDRERPDLVVYGGDNICDFAPSMLLKEENVKKCITDFLTPVTERKIPFCVVFGNHDTMSRMSVKEQMKYIMSFPGCYAVPGSLNSGVGNYSLLIKDSEGSKNVFNLWFLNSGVRATGRGEKGYAYVSDEQIAWYESVSEELRKENGGSPMPAILFQHIPVPEIYHLLTTVPKGTKGSVRGHGSHKDSHYILNPDLVFSGAMGEAPCPPDINNGQFESWRKQGDILGAFFGHDHLNDFSGSLQGIDLVHTPGAGFYSYGKGYEHGVRIIELDENNLQSYETRMVYYKDVSDKKAPWPFLYLGEQLFTFICTSAVIFLILMYCFIQKIRKWSRQRRQR